MMKLTVNKHRCPQNHRCPAMSVCPTEAITQEGVGLPQIDQDKCIQCRKCINYCPMDAFEMVED